MQQQPLHFVDHDNGPGNDQYYVTRIDDMDSGVADGSEQHPLPDTGGSRPGVRDRLPPHGQSSDQPFPAG
jgi:hypothetical protein